MKSALVFAGFLTALVLVSAAYSGGLVERGTAVVPVTTALVMPGNTVHADIQIEAVAQAVRDGASVAVPSLLDSRPSALDIMLMLLMAAGLIVARLIKKQRSMHQPLGLQHRPYKERT